MWGLQWFSVCCWLITETNIGNVVIGLCVHSVLLVLEFVCVGISQLCYLIIDFIV